MKRLLLFPAFIYCLTLVSCGGEQKEHPIGFGSERSELKGDPRSIVYTSIDTEDIPAHLPGDTLSVTVRYYNEKGDLTIFEYYDYTSEDNDYTRTFQYDENDQLTTSEYQYHSDDSRNYSVDYTWRNGMIAKQEYYDHEGIFNYYKYAYKGNKETSNSLYDSRGVKERQTNTTWDGDRVVKQVQKSDGEGSEIVYTIEYPDELTEKISINGFGPEDDGLSIERIVTFLPNGDYKTYTTITEEATTELHYSHQYDHKNNWITRTVTYPDGKPYTVETREITYY